MQHSHRGLGYFSRKKLIDKRLYITILAHKNEKVLETQIENILHYNPDAGVVLYNGGDEHTFGESLDIPICPYSKPIKWIYQSRVLYDVMRWFKQESVNYEYLVNFDHDMLFVKSGFEEFLDRTMEKLDCLGWQMLKGSQVRKFPSKVVPKSLWKEWHIWQPIFKTDDFLRYFNPGQVYRRRIIDQMLTFLDQKIDENTLGELLDKSDVVGFEEMFCPTLAMACGGIAGEYPAGNRYNYAVRWGKDIRHHEVRKVIRNPRYYWIHPVKENYLIHTNDWLQKGSDP